MKNPGPHAHLPVKPQTKPPHNRRRQSPEHPRITQITADLHVCWLKVKVVITFLRRLSPYCVTPPSRPLSFVFLCATMSLSRLIMCLQPMMEKHSRDLKSKKKSSIQRQPKQKKRSPGHCSYCTGRRTKVLFVPLCLCTSARFVWNVAAG